MSRPTTETDGARRSSALVPSVGFLLAGVALAALLSPVSRGVDDPVVWAAVATGVVAVGILLARRHGLVSATYGGPVAAISSVAVVLLSAYALNLGLGGTVDVAAGVSVPPVFVAFVTAAGAVAAAVADSLEIPLERLRRQVNTTAVLAAVGFLTLVATYAWVTVLYVPATALVDTVTEVHLQVLSQVGLALGTATLAAGYFAWSGLDRSFLDVRRPTRGDLAWTVGGFVVVLVAYYGISVAMTVAGVEQSSHGTTERVAENPELLAVLVPASFLVVGPCEELLYRNVIQKSMYEVFSRPGAVVVASVVFAAVHASAYATSGPGAVLASLGVVFGLSLVLGAVYERTGNVLVPAVVHGAYNALTFVVIGLG